MPSERSETDRSRRHFPAAFAFFLLFVIGILPALAPATAAAANITLEWQRSNPVENVVGYRIYYRIGRTGNGVLANYDGTGIVFDGSPLDGSPVDSGSAIEVADLTQQDDLVSADLRNLDSMQAYCFVVTAYNDDGQSGPSNELCTEDQAVADIDGDGMDDDWETFHGLDPLDASDASGDIDADGRANAQEYADRTDPTVAEAVPGFTEDFESATLAGYWSANSTGAGRIRVTYVYGPAEGNYHLTMDTDLFKFFPIPVVGPDQESGSLSELVLTVALGSYRDVTLSFYHKEFNDEDHEMPESFTGTHNSDGVAISADGVTWYKVQGLTSADSISNEWQRYSVDLDAAIAAAGISDNDRFKIKFQQFGQNPISTGFFAPTSDGFAFDDIEVRGGISGHRL